MSELRKAAQAALTAYETFRDVDDIDGLDDAIDRLRAALAQPKTELRDQHKAFTHWYFGLRGINEANFSPEDLAWAAWKAALSAPDVPDVLDELPMPPAGHPLYKLGDRLAHYLDDDKFNECERLLLEGWNHDRIDRKTGEDWLDIEPPEEKPVAWQVRWIDPEEGPGAWRFCLDPSEADYYANREDHDWRPLYTHPPRDEWREAAEEALRWMEHARLHLTIKERMHPDGLSLYDSAAEALRAALAKPEVEPPRDEWREAVRDEWRPASEPPDSDRDVQAWIKIDLSELDGVVTEQCDAQAFYEDGAWHVRGPDHDGWMQLCPGHMVSVVVWRDVTPPMEGA